METCFRFCLWNDIPERFFFLPPSNCTPNTRFASLLSPLCFPFVLHQASSIYGPPTALFSVLLPLGCKCQRSSLLLCSLPQFQCPNFFNEECLVRTFSQSQNAVHDPSLGGQARLDIIDQDPVMIPSQGISIFPNFLLAYVVPFFRAFERFAPSRDSFKLPCWEGCHKFSKLQSQLCINWCWSTTLCCQDTGTSTDAGFLYHSEPRFTLSEGPSMKVRLYTRAYIFFLLRKASEL